MELNVGDGEMNPELQRLQALLDAGTITREEFETLRSHLNEAVRFQSSAPSVVTGLASPLCPAQIVGFAGSAILLVGCFLPLVHLPIVGSINYVYNGRGDGIIVLALAVGSAILIALKKYRTLAFVTFVIAGVCAFTFIRFAIMIGDLRHSMDSDLNGNPFRGLADVLVNSVSLDWAWGVLLVGIILLVASALWMVRDQSEQA
jgi:hypothetical protein